MSLPPQLAWKVDRARAGAAKFAPAVDTSLIDDEVILAMLAAAAEEYGEHDPADLASVIDWPVLQRRDETRDQHFERVAAIQRGRDRV